MPRDFKVTLDPSDPRLVNFEWNRPATFNTKIEQYEIYYKTGVSWEMSKVSGTTSSLRNMKFDPGTNYVFKIRARDINTWGDFTNEISVRTMDGERNIFVNYSINHVKPVFLLIGYFELFYPIAFFYLFRYISTWPRPESNDIINANNSYNHMAASFELSHSICVWIRGYNPGPYKFNECF